MLSNTLQDMEYRTQTRPSSAIHIQLIKSPDHSPTIPSPSHTAALGNLGDVHVDSVRTGEALASRT